jgi:hypothetical protein
MSSADQAAFALKTEYSTPYAALIREDVVMGVSRYFIERWLPVLGPGPATVVNTLRQHDYRCHNEAITISGEALAREAAMSRRHLYTCLETSWIKAFVRLESGQHVRSEDGKIVQQPNRYFIRMDDPLTPADAEHLMTALSNLADSPLDAARRALEMDARTLWAPTPNTPAEHFTAPRPITAQDVLKRAFPTWKPANDVQKHEFAQAAESLHRHMTLTREDGRTSKIIVPQYFRKRWWKRLGHDLAWGYLWLRGWCMTTQTKPLGGTRDGYFSECMLVAIGRPANGGGAMSNQSTSNGWSLTDFFQQIGAQKGRDPVQPQSVARQFSVTLDIPLAPEDRARYAELLNTWQDRPILLSPASPETSGSATPEHTGEPEVSLTHAHRNNRGLPRPDTPGTSRSATPEHTGEVGVCHEPTQGSATPVHRESESKTQALNSENKLTSSKQPPGSTDIIYAAAAPGIPLIDQIADILAHAPDTPLYSCAAAPVWLREVWPEPVLPHTPAWTLVNNGQISPRDLVALILAIWADTSIKHPPRYLSWLAQRWQTLPETSPVDQWDRWRALADLSLDRWPDEGRREWIELAARDNRALPFGLDALIDEQIDTEEPLPAAESSIVVTRTVDLPPPENVPNGLDERPGTSHLTIREIWMATLGRLSVQLNGATYNNWVEGTKAVSYVDGVLTVRARHITARDWLSERLNPTIETTASALAQQPITVRYVVDPPLNLRAEAPMLD